MYNEASPKHLETGTTPKIPKLERRTMSCDPVYYGNQVMETPEPTMTKKSFRLSRVGMTKRKAQILARDYEKQKKAAQMLTAEEKRLLMEELRPKGWQRPESITKPLTPIRLLRSPTSRSYRRLEDEELVAEEHLMKVDIEDHSTKHEEEEDPDKISIAPTEPTELLQNPIRSTQISPSLIATGQASEVPEEEKKSSKMPGEAARPETSQSEDSISSALRYYIYIYISRTKFFAYCVSFLILGTFSSFCGFCCFSLLGFSASSILSMLPPLPRQTDPRMLAFDPIQLRFGKRENRKQTFPRIGTGLQ